MSNSTKSLGIVDVYHKENAEWLTPALMVKAVWWKNAGSGGEDLLFDYAYTSLEALTRQCWWYKDHQIRPNLIISPLTFEDYLRLHLKLPAMNPFWAIGRMEFVEEFKKLNPTWKL